MVIAVSGGPDSVALLHVLQVLATSLALRLHVVHVDHRLRSDSASDAVFVRELCRARGLPVDVVTVVVPAGGSPEERARRARYRALEDVADRIGADRIAVGHTADDQAETVLMRLFQGAGPRGLAGIPAARGRVIRPLLEARRADVVALLRGEGLQWREDSSNEDRRMLRNRIRHDVLPSLATVSPGLVPALARAARLARATVETIDATAAAVLAEAASTAREGLTLPLARLRALPGAVAAEVLRQAAASLGAPPALRAWAHRGLARVLADPPPRRPFRLGTVCVEVSASQVRLARGRRPAIDPRRLAVPGLTILPGIGLGIGARLVDAAGYEIPHDRWIVAFDADVLTGPLAVRARERGDRVVPFGGGTRRLKELLIDAGVPRWDRDTVPVVEAGGRIVWVAGVRRGDAAPVTASTRRVLELRLLRLAPLAENRPGR